MSRAEEFIKAKTRIGSNTTKGWRRNGVSIPSYSLPWLTPDQARKAVEIAREEVINDIKESVTIFLEGAHEYTDNKELQMQYDNEGLIRDFRAFIEDRKQAMKYETKNI